MTETQERVFLHGMRQLIDRTDEGLLRAAELWVEYLASEETTLTPMAKSLSGLLGSWVQLQQDHIQRLESTKSLRDMLEESGSNTNAVIYSRPSVNGIIRMEATVIKIEIGAPKVMIRYVPDEEGRNAINQAVDPRQLGVATPQELQEVRREVAARRLQETVFRVERKLKGLLNISDPVVRILVSRFDPTRIQAWRQAGTVGDIPWLEDSEDQSAERIVREVSAAKQEAGED